MSLTAEQISDLQADLGAISGDYTPDQLNRNWDRVSGAADTTARYDATLGLCFRQAKAKYLLVHDYQAGAVNEKLSQVQKFIDDMLAIYEPALNAALSTHQTVVISKVGSKPHQTRTEPAEYRDSSRKVPPDA